jgi:hypothetical protein
VFTQTFETKKNNQNKQHENKGDSAVSVIRRSKGSRKTANVKSRNTEMLISPQPDLFPFQLFFSIQGTVGSTAGPDPENRVGDQDIGSPGRPVSSGLQVPRE